jgi:hypothetical protein
VFLDDEQDEQLDRDSDEEEGYLEGEETLEELDIDDRGHLRPRRRKEREEEFEWESDL